MTLAIAAICMALAAGVHAQDPSQTLISNTGQGEDGSGEELSDTVPLRAQRFWTGRNDAGYNLASVGIAFGQIADSSPHTRLGVTVNRATDRVLGEQYVVPGEEVCTLAHPASHSASEVYYFDSPTGGCTLEGDTGYFVVVERTDTAGDGITLQVTESAEWDPVTATRWWGISPHRHSFDGDSWDRTTGEAHMIDVRGSACDDLWCAVLTVGSDGDDGDLGWSDAGAPGGDLSDVAFVYGDDEYELHGIRLTSDGALTVTFERHGAGQIESQAIRYSLELRVDDLRLNLGVGELQDDMRTIRWDAGLDWSEEQRLPLRMVEMEGRPLTPSDLVAVSGDSAVELLWETLPSAPGTTPNIKHEYRQRTTDPYGEWQVIDQSGADQKHENSYTVSGLTNGAEYTFQVRAENSSGQSGDSNEATATPNECDAFWCGALTAGQLSLDVGNGIGYNGADSVGSLSNKTFVWKGDVFTVKWLYTSDTGVLEFGLTSGVYGTDLEMLRALGSLKKPDFNQLNLGDTGYHIGDGEVSQNTLYDGGEYRGWVEVDWSIPESPLGGGDTLTVKLVHEVGGL